MDITPVIAFALGLIVGGGVTFLWTRYNDANHPGKNARYDQNISRVNQQLAEAQAEIERLRAKARTHVENRRS